VATAPAWNSSNQEASRVALLVSCIALSTPHSPLTSVCRARPPPNTILKCVTGQLFSYSPRPFCFGQQPCLQRSHAYDSLPSQIIFSAGSRASNLASHMNRCRHKSSFPPAPTQLLPSTPPPLAPLCPTNTNTSTSSLSSCPARFALRTQHPGQRPHCPARMPPPREHPPAPPPPTRRSSSEGLPPSAPARSRLRALHRHPHLPARGAGLPLVMRLLQPPLRPAARNLCGGISGRRPATPSTPTPARLRQRPHAATQR